MPSQYREMSAHYHTPALAPYLDTPPAPMGAGTTGRVVALFSGLLAELGVADRIVQASPERYAAAVAAGVAAGRAQLLTDIAAAGRITETEATAYRAAAHRATTCARLADLWARLRREVERRRCLSYTTNA